MDKADAVIQEMCDKYSEWLEMMSETQTYNFMLNAMAVEVVREREKAENYKMALKRCEIMKQ